MGFGIFKEKIQGQEWANQTFELKKRAMGSTLIPAVEKLKICIFLNMSCTKYRLYLNFISLKKQFTKYLVV